MNQPPTSEHPFFFINNGPFEKLVNRNFKRLGHQKPFVALIWVWIVVYLPLWILCGMEHSLFKGYDMPFIMDWATHMRILIAIPLVILSRPIVLKSTIQVCEYVSDYLLDEKERQEKFFPAFEKVRKWNDSWMSELIIILCVILMTIFMFYRGINNRETNGLTTWYGFVSNGEVILSKAAWWSLFVSTTVYRFIILRWLWIYLCWVWLLIKISRMHLHLAFHHRDRACGLNLLVFPQKTFNLFFIAMAFVSSGMFINDIIYEHVPFTDIKTEIILMLIVCLVMLLGPYLFFLPMLIEAKEKAHFMMSKKSSTLSEAYHSMWIKTGNIGLNETEKPDPSVMADFNTTYEVTEKIRMFPFNTSDIIVLGVPIVLAYVPALLTNITPKELLEFAIRFVV